MIFQVLRGVDLSLYLVVDILTFEPFVTRVTDMDATVKLLNNIFIGIEVIL